MRKQLFRSIFICGVSAIGIIVGIQKPALAADMKIEIVKNNAAKFVFAVPDAVIKAGDSITWVAINKKVTHHLVPGPANGAPKTPNDAAFNDTGEFENPTQPTQKFTEKGVIHYHCSIHPTMDGTITVE